MFDVAYSLGMYWAAVRASSGMFEARFTEVANGSHEERIRFSMSTIGGSRVVQYGWHLLQEAWRYMYDSCHLAALDPLHR